MWKSLKGYAEWVDIANVAVIKSQRFIPKSDAARAGW